MATLLLIIPLILGLFLIPLGLPGIWVMVAAVGVGVLLGEVAPGVLVLAALLAGAAEVLEFLLVKRLAERYGGSRLAFWGAILGGIAGVMVGLPLPVVGPVLAGLIGTFLGAGLLTLWETGEATRAGRAGWGAILGRAASAAVKVAAGLVILVVGSGSLMLR